MKQFFLLVLTVLLLISKGIIYGESLDNQVSQNKFNNLLFYYGDPSFVDEDSYDYDKIGAYDKKLNNKRVQKAINYFSKFQKVIMPGFVALDKNNPEYENLKLIINSIKENTTSFGYIALYDEGKANSMNICNQIKDVWNGMGVGGIFFDEAGFDFFSKTGGTYGDYKKMLKQVYKCAKDNNYEVIFNSWSASDIINNLKLSKDDGVLIESFYYSDGIKEQGYIDNVERYKKLKDKTSAKYYCVSTGGKNANIYQLNNIGYELKDEILKVCDYRSIQDDYGSDNNVSTLDDDFYIKAHIYNRIDLFFNLLQSNYKKDKLKNKINILKKRIKIIKNNNNYKNKKLFDYIINLLENRIKKINFN